MARRVDQVDLILGLPVLPRASRRGGFDRDATLLLFNEEVHRGGAFVHLSHLVVLAGVVKNALGDGGFASVDVSADADVACE